jgi:hypothetical protein
MSKNINSILKEMRSKGRVQDMKGKGDAGEEAALQIILQKLSHTGGTVYHSFKYPYQSNREGITYLGNIKYENGGYVEYTDAKDGRTLIDEIDILYISPYRIFPIEVKSYHAKLSVFDFWMKKQGVMVDKSPITQAEKHARHLYHAIHDVLPDGSPDYIVPIVCFVDRCKLDDSRSEEQIDYIPCCILNNLKATVSKNNTPLDFNLDIQMIRNKLKEVEIDGQEYCGSTREN